MSETPPPPTIWNVPNQVTVSRLILTIVLFVFLSLGWYVTSLVVFLIAAGTDWVDGYYARKFGQVTQLGRILDPFADKLIICGAFIYLCAAPRLVDGVVASGIAVWVAVLVTGRELLVTALRSFVEGHGGDFSAKWIGKWKMAIQCAAASFSMGRLSYVDFDQRIWQTQPPGWISFGLELTVWLTVLLTLYSAIVYVIAAVRMLKNNPHG